MKDTTLALLISAGGLAVSVAGLGFVALQVRLLMTQVSDAKDIFVTEQERSRRQSSFEFIATTMERRAELQQKVPAGGDLVRVEQYLEALKNDPLFSPRRSELSRVLGYYENVAVAVNAQVFDFDIIERAWGTVIVRTFAGYRNYIYERRQRLKQPKLYIEFEELAERILSERGALA